MERLLYIWHFVFEAGQASLGVDLHELVFSGEKLAFIVFKVKEWQHCIISWKFLSTPSTSARVETHSETFSTKGAVVGLAFLINVSSKRAGAVPCGIPRGLVGASLLLLMISTPATASWRTTFAHPTVSTAAISQIQYLPELGSYQAR